MNIRGRLRRFPRRNPILTAILLIILMIAVVSGAVNLDVPAPPDTDTAETDVPDVNVPEGAPWVTVNGEAVPEYSDEPFYELNGNVPVFGADEMTDRSYEYYSARDEYNRCGTAIASIGRDLMPTDPRESISHVYPSGWHSVIYPFVDNGGSLYNRCHMIAFQLTGENANPENLITGTRYFNVEGMFPFEDMVADYIRETGNHVAYRVTPIFVGRELVCRGVVMSAKSVEDDGEDIMYNVFIYNVQPGVIINYETGKSTFDPDYDPKTGKKHLIGDYVLNTAYKEFHLPTCPVAESIPSDAKRTFTGDRYQLRLDEYSPCRSCKP